VSTVHAFVPDGVDDPARPSGGNVYDRRLFDALVDVDWSVREHVVHGSWPRPDRTARDGLARELATLPDGAVVLLDGLVASTVPDVLVPQARRLRLVVLMHMPMGQRRTGGIEAREAECAVLLAAAAVVTTSAWTRRWLLDHYPLADDRVRVAQPGADIGKLALRTDTGGELICVAAVTPGKGHDVLLEALAGVGDLAWRCLCVGDLTREPELVEQLTARARATGVADRVHFAGPMVTEDLASSYAAADALVHASRAETYGMVVTEALSHGLPVIATETGGLPEAMGRLPDGRRPGLLVPPGNAPALSAALRRWLTDSGLRRSLAVAAEERRASLIGWHDTARRVAHLLTEVAA
jgi:glycosyltransferase involved in cell wall biosynthesis